MIRAIATAAVVVSLSAAAPVAAQRTGGLQVHGVVQEGRATYYSDPPVEYRVYGNPPRDPFAVGRGGALRVAAADPQGRRLVELELRGAVYEGVPVVAGSDDPSWPPLVSMGSRALCVHGLTLYQLCPRVDGRLTFHVLHPWLEPFPVPDSAAVMIHRQSELLADDRLIVQRPARPGSETNFAALARDGTYVPFRLREAPSPADAWYGVHGRVLYYPAGGALRVHDWRAREEREVEGVRPDERVSRVCEDGHQAVYVTLLDTGTSRARVARLTPEGRLEHVLDVPSPFLVSCLRGGGFVSMAVGSRELVHVDRRGQHRWQLASPIGSAGAWRQSPPQITEWLWVIGEGEIDMVDLQPLFAWTPVHPREPPEETPEPAAAD